MSATQNDEEPRPAGEPEEGSRRARYAAGGATLLAVLAVAWLLFGGGGAYTVKARFMNAGQLVKGNPVQSGGVAVGSVSGIRITPDGQAEVALELKDDFGPLRTGTRAAIRQLSLSGIANRYVDLSVPPRGGGQIPDGGLIGVDRTETAVDLDQLFNTLDPRTRKSLRGFFRGSARQFAGRGDAANAGYRYLNPALSTSSRLFGELSHDTPVLERFLADSSHLVTALAERREDLAGLVGNLNETTRALGNQKAALAGSIEQLPPFMRRANTTFVDLRAALRDVDPLVEASRPAARRLGPVLTQARGLAADAEPTVRDLSLTIARRGRDNDLIDLLEGVPPFADAAVATRRRAYAPGGRRVDVGRTAGAFREGAAALRNAAPVAGIARPYTNDLLAWFDDFSATGGYDALGAYSRASINFDEYIYGGPAKSRQYRRCPGGGDIAAPDRSNVLNAEEQAALDCRESDRAAGP